MSDNPLGKQVKYDMSYDKSLLFPIERMVGRTKILLNGLLPFKGYDLWNCYELSWLNLSGKPEVRILSFIVSADSQYLIESKSIKLYLNSFNNMKFTNDSAIHELIKKDLSNVSKSDVKLQIGKLDEYNKTNMALFDGICLDNLDIEINDYQVNKSFLKLESVTNNEVEEILYSNLFKSNCLVTNQPDWASIMIKYKGKKINHESLLKYLISYRNHSGFHEECVERIFVNLMEICSPKELSILAKYTRRGGVDINPFRTNLDLKSTEIDKIRDVRQ